MSLDFVQNFVRGELFAPMTDTDTSMDVQDVTGFPNPDNKGAYNMVIFDQTQFARPSEDSDAEIVRLTSVKNASEFNVLRGQENTFPGPHPVGSAVYLSATAKVFDDVEQDIAAVQSDADANTQSISAVQSDADANTQSINNLPDDFVVSGEGREFEVQKDGTDGQGIINFKTS